MNMKLKFVAAAVTLLGAAAAHADPFYLDVNTNYDAVNAPLNGKVCNTCTSQKDEFNIRYQSQTTLSGLAVGATTSTTGGLALAGANVSTNRFTALTPAAVFGNPSDNGFNTNYYISFAITGLTGTVTGFYGVGGLPAITYNAGGVIDFYITFDGTTMINFMDINITGGASDGNGTGVTGVVDFSSIDAAGVAYRNLFHSTSASCPAGSGYYDIWNSCGENLEITLNSHFDTTTAAINGTTVTGIHDGSGTFDVNRIPEPASLALVGLGLVGAGFARRRKAA